MDEKLNDIVDSSIAQDIIECVGGDLSHQVDKEQLLDILSKVENGGELLINMSNPERVEGIYSMAERGDKKSDISNLVSSINRLKVRRRRRVVTALSTSIAAAVIAVSFLLLNPKKDDDKISYTTIEAMTIKTPTIILGDGKRVEIENSENSLLGNVVVDSKKRNVEYARDNSKEHKIDNHTIVIPSHTTYMITLADGTEVTLNAGSVLKYPEYFAGDTPREVHLEGEAYFKVSKSAKPFIVKTDVASVKVYGTEFNVNTQKGSVETLLVKGSVGVTLTNKEVMLEPNQILRYNNVDNIYSVEVVDSGKYLGWLNGDFKYNNEELNKLLVDMERWYRVDFNYDYQLIKDVKITVLTSREETMGDMIKIIERLTNLTIINDGGGKYEIIKL